MKEVMEKDDAVNERNGLFRRTRKTHFRNLDRLGVTEKVESDFLSVRASLVYSTGLECPLFEIHPLQG